LYCSQIDSCRPYSQRNVTNCAVMYVHVEAEYAFNTHKRILALRLESDYMPDGWLGVLCLNNLFYDFSASDKFDDEWIKLHAKLKELDRSGIHSFSNTIIHYVYIDYTVVHLHSFVCAKFPRIFETTYFIFGDRTLPKKLAVNQFWNYTELAEDTDTI